MTCETCENWVPTIPGVLGFCKADIENKMAHQSCVWEKPRGSEGTAK